MRKGAEAGALAGLGPGARASTTWGMALPAIIIVFVLGLICWIIIARGNPSAESGTGAGARAITLRTMTVATTWTTGSIGSWGHTLAGSPAQPPRHQLLLDQRSDQCGHTFHRHLTGNSC